MDPDRLVVRVFYGGGEMRTVLLPGMLEELLKAAESAVEPSTDEDEAAYREARDWGSIGR